MRSLILVAFLAGGAAAAGTACETAKSGWFQCASTTNLSPGEICVPLCAGENAGDPCVPCDPLADLCAKEWPNYLKSFNDGGKWLKSLPPNDVLKGECPSDEKARSNLVSSVICVNSNPNNKGCRNFGSGNDGQFNIGDGNRGDNNIGNNNEGSGNRGSGNKANCARGNANTVDGYSGNEDKNGETGVKCLAPGQTTPEDAVLKANNSTEKSVPADGGPAKAWAGDAAPPTTPVAVTPAKGAAAGAAAAAEPAAADAAPAAKPAALAAKAAPADDAAAPAATPKAAAATPKPTAAATPKPTKAPAATPAAAAEPATPPAPTPAPLKTGADSAPAAPTKLAPLPGPEPK